MLIERIDRLRQRALIVRALRVELDFRGFIEVQTPCLVPGTCPDRAIHSFLVPAGGYLVSSSEYQLKRLFAEGVVAAYTLGPNFRRGDLGEAHNPEFTMVEWGRVGAAMAEVEAEAEAMVRRAGEAVGQPVPARWGRRTVRELIGQGFGAKVGRWEDLESIPGPFAGGDSAHLSWLLDEGLGHVDPAVPTWITGWPAHMTTSAGLDPADPTTTQRSELYWRGLELSDGFPFASDAAWQRERAKKENQQRILAGEPPVVLDERFLEAVGDLPSGAGMAMGVDRLCMALLNVPRLSDVTAFAWADR